MVYAEETQLYLSKYQLLGGRPFLSLMKIERLFTCNWWDHVKFYFFGLNIWITILIDPLFVYPIAPSKL